MVLLSFRKTSTKFDNVRDLDTIAPDGSLCSVPIWGSCARTSLNVAPAIAPVRTE